MVKVIFIWMSRSLCYDIYHLQDDLFFLYYAFEFCRSGNTRLVIYFLTTAVLLSLGTLVFRLSCLIMEIGNDQGILLLEHHVGNQLINKILGFCVDFFLSAISSVISSEL